MVMKIIKSVFKRGGRVLIGGLSILFAMTFILPMILANGYSWLHSDPARDIVRSYIEQQAKAQGYRLEMVGFSYDLDKDAISASRVDLYDATGLLLRMKAVNIDADMRAFLAGTVDATLSVRDVIFYNNQEISTTYSVSNVRADVNAVLDKDMVGAVDIKAVYRDKGIFARSDFSLSEKSLSLSDTLVSAPDLRMEGSAVVLLSNNLARGQFSGRLGKLSFYQHIIGAGHELDAATFGIALTATGGRQSNAKRRSIQFSPAQMICW